MNLAIQRLISPKVRQELKEKSEFLEIDPLESDKDSESPQEFIEL